MSEFPPQPEMPPVCPQCSQPMRAQLRSRDKQPMWACSTSPICWGILDWKAGWDAGQKRADAAKLSGIVEKDTSADAAESVKLLRKLSKAGLLERQPKPRKPYGGLLEDGGLEWLEAVRPFDE